MACTAAQRLGRQGRAVALGRPLLWGGRAPLCPLWEPGEPLTVRAARNPFLLGGGGAGSAGHVGEGAGLSLEPVQPAWEETAGEIVPSQEGPLSDGVLNRCGGISSKVAGCHPSLLVTPFPVSGLLCW